MSKSKASSAAASKGKGAAKVKSSAKAGAKALAKAKKSAPKKAKAAATKKAAPAPEAGGAPSKKSAPAQSVRRRVLLMDLRYENDLVEVFWSVRGGERVRGARPNEGEEGFRWEGYYVRVAVLDGVSKMIREALQDLQRLDWNIDVLQAPDEAFAELFGETAEHYRPVLGRLLSAGQELHNAILRGMDAEAEPAAAKFRAWFEREMANAPPGYLQIDVAHTSFEKTIAPWALACTPMKREEVEALNPLDPDGYSNFWGSRFGLAVRGIDDQDEDPEVVDGGSMGLACALELDETAFASIEEWDSGKRTRMDDHIGWDLRGYNRLARQYESRHVFWYISLQHDGGSYKLGQSPLGSSDLSANRSVHKVKNALSKDGDGQVRIVLMMLDGDAVIRNDRGADWLEKALALGRAGLIAVEADIDNPQLRHFGWRLLRHVLTSGKSLRDAMNDARRTFWPLALLFGVYGSPLNAKVAPPPKPTIASIDNFLKEFRSFQARKAEGA